MTDIYTEAEMMVDLTIGVINPSAAKEIIRTLLARCREQD